MTANNGYYSGYAPVENYVFINEAFWGLGYDVQMSALAHEETHSQGLDGPNHNTGFAASAAQICGGD